MASINQFYDLATTWLRYQSFDNRLEDKPRAGTPTPHQYSTPVEFFERKYEKSSFALIMNRQIYVSITFKFAKPWIQPSLVIFDFHIYFLEWQPCHSPAMVFFSSRAIYQRFFLCPLWGRPVFLSPISNYYKIELGMAQLYDLTHLGGIGITTQYSCNSSIPCNDIIVC